VLNCHWCQSVRPQSRLPPGSHDGLLLTDCRDCTLSSLQVFSADQPEGALTLRRCRRVNVTGCSILDSAGCGILLESTTAVRVSDCLVANDRPSTGEYVALRLTGGRGNMVVSNLLSGRVEMPPGSGFAQGNYSGDQSRSKDDSEDPRP